VHLLILPYQLPHRRIQPIKRERTATETSLGGRWVVLLKEIAPRVSRIAILFNPTAAPYAE
jgi:hypothetical protein